MMLSRKNSIKLIFFCGTLQVALSRECPEVVDSAVWGGQRIRGGSPLNTPVRYVVIHRTATSKCTTRRECTKILRNARNGNGDGRPSEIASFSFIVGGDGVVYRARGWDSEGTHAPEYNRRSVGIALIGRFENQSPTQGQLRATKKLIECGVQKGKLRRDYRIIGHRQISSTDCPGNLLYAKIKEWPKWYSVSDYDEDGDEDY